MDCLYLLLFAMNPAAPDGAPPRRISVSKYICKHRTAPPCLGEALRRGSPEIAWFNDFHSLGANSRSCPFPMVTVPHIFTSQGVWPVKFTPGERMERLIAGVILRSTIPVQIRVWLSGIVGKILLKQGPDEVRTTFISDSTRQLFSCTAPAPQIRTLFFRSHKHRTASQRPEDEGIDNDPFHATLAQAEIEFCDEKNDGCKNDDPECCGYPCPRNRENTE